MSPISSLDGYIGAVKEVLTWVKTASVTGVAGRCSTVFDQAGQPGAGTLNVGNTANGLVHTDLTAGYPIISAFGGTGYVSGIDFSNIVACRIALFDRLFVAGAYTYNTDTTLASQPGFSGRVPNGNYNGLQLWVEAVTAFTLVPAFQIDYLDQDGGAGVTGSIAADTALIIRRCWQMPLAAGDSGIQQVNRVRCITASAGTFNVMILRPLWVGRVPTANAGDVHDFLRTGLPQIYDTSALYVLIAADSTATGAAPSLQIEIANG